MAFTWSADAIAFYVPATLALDFRAVEAFQLEVEAVELDWRS